MIFINQVFNRSNLEICKKHIVEQTYKHPIIAVISAVALTVLGFNGIASYSISGVLLGGIKLSIASLMLYHILNNFSNFKKLVIFNIQYYQAKEEEKGSIQLKTAKIIENISKADAKERQRDLTAKPAAKFILSQERVKFLEHKYGYKWLSKTRNSKKNLNIN